jgi:hypothetical protein
LADVRTYIGIDGTASKMFRRKWQAVEKQQIKIVIADVFQRAKTNLNDKIGRFNPPSIG